MRQVRWASWAVGLTLALVLSGVRPAAADVTSDEAAAILIWPDIAVFGVGVTNAIDFEFAIDTVVQVTNTSPDPVTMKCFYENANGHCDNTGAACGRFSDCFFEGRLGNCIPGWNEVDFRVNLTPFQPLGWLASEGMAGFAGPLPLDYGVFPLDGFFFSGIGGANNAGSLIPPVAEDPFDGVLKCIAVDDADNPIGRNVLKGESTLIVFARLETDREACPRLRRDGMIVRGEEGGGAGIIPIPPICFDYKNVAKHNAIGIKAIPDANNGDRRMVLGGEGAEYNGCPNFLILDHFFDFAANPAVSAALPAAALPLSAIFTELVLVPCTQDLLRQIPGSAVVQYLVYNEFEQRFSTSRSMTCKQNLMLSLIDTTQPRRSIFSVGVAGTLTGQTRMNPIGSGLVGMARETHLILGLAEFNLHLQGDRADSDIITLP